MLTLICAPAVMPYRNHLIANGIIDDTLYVLPDRQSAKTFAVACLCAGKDFLPPGHIWDFDSFLSELLPASDAGGLVVSDSVLRAVIRNLMEEDEKAFDYLVGRNSVPHISPGVLDLIIRSIDSLKMQLPGDEEQGVEDSPRWRQLRLLSERLEERLQHSGYKPHGLHLMGQLAELNRQTWPRVFAKIKRVVFMDFMDFSDLVYLSMAAVARSVDGCEVLLEYDPEENYHGQSAMENAHLRLFDMADRYLLAPEDLIDDWEPGAKSVLPLVVSAKTVSSEVKGAVSAIRKLLDDADEGSMPSIVVVLPDWNNYVALLETELENSGVDAVFFDQMSPYRSGGFVLLSRLADCSDKFVTGDAISKLLRAPGFPSLMGGSFSSVDTWNLASRLDYVLTFTGKLTGWGDIKKSVAGVVKRLQSDRKKQNQWSEEEGVLDIKLIEILDRAHEFSNGYAKKLEIQDWCRLVSPILFGFSSKLPERENYFANFELIRKSNDALVFNLAELGFSSKVIDAGSIGFKRFLALYQTSLDHVRVDNSDKLQQLPVAVCGPDQTEKLRSDCCIILGCNDGSYPRFARPEASFGNSNFHIRQSMMRSRQRVGLTRICANHGRVLMWMPEKAGTEDLLPSQFVEEMVGQGLADFMAAEELLQVMGAGKSDRINVARQELVESLTGLRLDEKELERFAQRGKTMYNIASGISVNAARSQRQLSEYDGIITDPRLREWLQGWAERHIYSVSQLDAAVGCSFRFFADRMLNLEELGEDDNLLPAHFFGSFTHDVLARFYRGWVADGKTVPKPGDEAIARIRLVEAYRVETRDFEELSSFASDLMKLKLFGELGPEGFESGIKPLEDSVDSGVFGQFLQMEMIRGSELNLDFLQPSNFEVGFGMGVQDEDDPLTIGEHVELNLGEGEKIKLRGRIDRIDISPGGVFAVTDYKTGRIPEKRQIRAGFRTQLPVYTMVAEILLQDHYPDIVPAGGLYYSLKKGVTDKVSGVFLRSSFHADAGVSVRSCMKDEDFEKTLDTVVELMRQSLKSVRMGYLTTTRHDPDSVCNFCAFENLCYRDVERTAAFWESIEKEDGVQLDGIETE